MFEDKVLISVVIPYFNALSTIYRALDSLVAQKFEQMEVIIVDDGSKDNVGFLTAEYAGKLKIRYFRKDNGGVSSARNLGIDKSNGEFVMFLDADDYYGENMVKDMIRCINETNSDVVICHCCYNGVENEFSYHKKRLTYDQFSKNFLLHNRLYQFCTAIYRNSIIKKYGIYFSTKYCNREDELFMWNYLVYCDTFCELPHAYYHYIIQESSASLRVDEARFKSIDAAYEIRNLLKKHGKSNYLYYERYEIPKGVLGLMRFFSKKKRKDLFNKFCSIYFKRKEMFWLLTYPNIKVFLCACVSIISLNLFYKIESEYGL